MSAPVNPYKAPPNMRIMVLFKAEVEAMDANSPSNSSNTSLSGTAESHQLGQPVANRMIHKNQP